MHFCTLTRSCAAMTATRSSPPSTTMSSALCSTICTVIPDAGFCMRMLNWKRLGLTARLRTSDRSERAQRSCCSARIGLNISWVRSVLTRWLTTADTLLCISHRTAISTRIRRGRGNGRLAGRFAVVGAAAGRYVVAFNDIVRRLVGNEKNGTR